MSKVKQLLAYQTRIVDETDTLSYVQGKKVEPDVFLLALMEDGSIYITQNPQLDMGSFDASCWKHLDPPPTY